MPKLCRVAKVKVLFLVFNFNLFEFSAAILEKGLFLTLVVVHFYCFIGPEKPLWGEVN